MKTINETLKKPAKTVSCCCSLRSPWPRELLALWIVSGSGSRDLRPRRPVTAEAEKTAGSSRSAPAPGTADAGGSAPEAVFQRRIGCT